MKVVRDPDEPLHWLEKVGTVLVVLLMLGMLRYGGCAPGW